MRDFLCAVIAFLGSAIASAFGGWDTAVITLIIFMAIDYATGVIVASVFHNSPKSKNGTLESRAGFKGLCRKFITIIFVLVGRRLDLVLGTNYVRDAVCIFFIANELVSIVENAGLMGIPIPAVITDSIEVLRDHAEEKPKVNEKTSANTNNDN